MGLEILYFLIPTAFLLAVIALGLFIWAIHSGQYDDLETPAIRLLFEEEPGANAGKTADGSGES